MKTFQWSTFSGDTYTGLGVPHLLSDIDVFILLQYAIQIGFAPQSFFEDYEGNEAEINDYLDTLTYRLIKQENTVSIPIGTIVYRATATLPDQWLYCNGDVQLKTAYPLLYETIGDTWGDIVTLYPEFENPELYFLLPDVRDVFLTGYMQGGGSPTFGSSGGAKTHTLTTAEMPSHVHSKADSSAGSGNFSSVASPYQGNGVAAGGWDTGSAGSGSAHNNMPPYKAMNAIIYAGE